jgi:hypothetical protein
MIILSEYTGYLSTPWRYDVDPSSVDMSELVTYYYSSGPCDPIVPSGTINRWTAHEINVPQWLINGCIKAGLSETYAKKISCNDTYPIRQIDSALSKLIGMKGKFASSLQQQWQDRGSLSANQIACVLRPTWKR